VYVDVLNYGTVSHTFGLLVSGCILTHFNCNLSILYILTLMLKCRAMVECNLVLRRCSTNGCLMWLLKFFHVQLVSFIVELRSKTHSCVLFVVSQTAARVML